MEVLTLEAFLHTDFDGNGYGQGSGSGSPSGSGFGSGSVHGSNYGVGRGYSSGTGYISGSGLGCGYASSSGCGDGSGGDHGSGDGIKSFNGQTVDMIDRVPTILTSIIGNAAKGFIVRPDFSLAPTFVCKQGNTFAHGETLHKAREALLEKLFDDMPTDERIAAFCKEFKPGVKRPAMDFFSWHHRLTGSCEQGRREFAKQHDIDIDRDELTPEEFFALTRDSYGSGIIRQTEEAFAARNGEIVEAEE
jgi:hypothetical protein